MRPFETSRTRVPGGTQGGIRHHTADRICLDVGTSRQFLLPCSTLANATAVPYLKWPLMYCYYNGYRMGSIHSGAKIFDTIIKMFIHFVVTNGKCPGPGCTARAHRATAAAVPELATTLVVGNQWRPLRFK